ncbi:MAG: sugar kinase [Candidatus Omnitrophota bacterium]|nr:MAG: sugar kinase [Candidatus Omnitrophota bacterium]
MSVLITGTVALDTITSPVGKCHQALGGSASYASVSASFFTPVNLVATVGKDFPKAHIQLFKRKGIDTQGLTIKKGKTFHWEGEYGWDFSDARTLATHINVLSQFNTTLPKDYTKSKYVFLANIDPQMQATVLKQVSSPRFVICDTMNYWISNARKHLVRLLKKIDMSLLNESEARQLSGQTNIMKAAKALLKLGPKILVIKKGEHGAIMFTNNRVICVPGFLLEDISDPTGAGDTFGGALVGYLASRSGNNLANLKSAVVYGKIMATFAVEDFSLRRLISLRKSDISKRFNEFRKFSCF